MGYNKNGATYLCAISQEINLKINLVCESEAIFKEK